MWNRTPSDTQSSIFKMFFSVLSLLPLPLLVYVAQSASLLVWVGEDSQLKFDPEVLEAAVGDTITYSFFAKNHAVAQSSFGEPCQPLAGGFFSGFVPNNRTNVSSETTFTITVNDTKPIWVYCPQTNGDHCQKGMVHAINPPKSGNNTFEAYKSKATMASKPSKSPVDGLPVGGIRRLRVEVASMQEGSPLTFSPSNITEPPGTVVRFDFNPQNHSVTQSSFADPCHQLDGGFNSGFVPTLVGNNGVWFDIVIRDKKPIWFYCAQPRGDHCQKGMVGAINAPTEGNTLEAFIALAKNASTSTMGAMASGSVNGTLFLDGVPLDKADKKYGYPYGGNQTTGGGPTYTPPPATNTSAETWDMAGGGQPDSYNWAPTLSSNATSLLQVLEQLDNILITVLTAGLTKLDAEKGDWKRTYPNSIIKIINTLSAQTLVHRAAATDSLAHYGATPSQTCSFTIPIATIDEWLSTALSVLLLQIGVVIDVVSQVAPTDPWLVPVLATEIGAKSRMTAVINLMQGHIAAAAPREAMIPATLGWSYAASHYVASCQGEAIKGLPDKTFPKLEVYGRVMDGERTSQVTVRLDTDWKKKGKLSVAWIGEWGTLRVTDVDGDGVVSVPAELYGHVWAVLVSGTPAKLSEVVGMTVAGPALVWVR